MTYQMNTSDYYDVHLFHLQPGKKVYAVLPFEEYCQLDISNHGVLFTYFAHPKANIKTLFKWQKIIC